jgi:putative transposase
LSRARRVCLPARSLAYYKAHGRNDLPVRQRIKEIAASRVRYGVVRIHALLKREGWPDNFKRVRRIYRE